MPDRAQLPWLITVKPDGTTASPPANSPVKLWDATFTASDASSYVATSGNPQIGGGEFSTLPGQEARIAIKPALFTPCYAIMVQGKFIATAAGGQGAVDVWVAAQIGGGGRAQITNQSILNTYPIGGGSSVGGQASSLPIVENQPFWVRYWAIQNIIRGEFWTADPTGTNFTEYPEEGQNADYVDTAIESWNWSGGGGLAGQTATAFTEPEIRINNSDAGGAVVCTSFRVWSFDSITL